MRQTSLIELFLYNYGVEVNLLDILEKKAFEAFFRFTVEYVIIAAIFFKYHFLLKITS